MDHLQVLFERSPENFLNLKWPRLAKDCHRLCPGFKELCEIQVSVSVYVWPTCHSEGCHVSEVAVVKGLAQFEEVDVRRVSLVRPASLDIVNPRRDKCFSYSLLLCRCEVYSNRLISIAKCCIVNFDRFWSMVIGEFGNRL